MNMEFKRKLIIPKEIKEMFPVTEEMATLKKSGMPKLRILSPAGQRSLCL